ncbi:MAG TPA: BamA/TamA family outer membrane protein [Bacteroidales bacterium]|nr:BamA/TamA family outer membrane protein [Bacteroidales bacterium]
MNKLKNKNFIPLILLIMLLATSCSVPKMYPDKKFIIKNEIKINYDTLDTFQTINKSDFNSFVRLKPNRKFLFIFRFYSSIYAFADLKLEDRSSIKQQKYDERIAKKKEKGKKINYEREQKKLNKGLRNYLLNQVGEPPTFYDPHISKISTEQMQLFAKTKGYFYAKVSDSLIMSRKNRYTLRYEINLGRPYIISSIDWTFLDTSIDQNILKNLFVKPFNYNNVFLINNINWQYLNNSFALTVLDYAAELPLKTGIIYDENLLDENRNLLATHLRNNGYYNFSKTFIQYEADTTLGNYNMHINTLIFPYQKKLNDTIISLPFQKYKISKIYINLGYNPLLSKEELKLDTVLYISTLNADTFYFVYPDNFYFKPKVIESKITLNPNQYYSEQRGYRTESLLLDIPIFSNTQVEYIPDSSRQGNFLVANVNINRYDLQRWGIDFETTTSSGIYGVNTTISYLNRSIFNGGELLLFQAKGGLEVEQLFSSNNLFRAYYFGADLSLSFPKLMIPFIKNIQTTVNTKPSTQIQLSYLFQKRIQYDRTLIAASYNLQFNETRYKYHQIQVPYINLIKIKPDSAYSEVINSLPSRLRYGYEDYLSVGARYSYTLSNKSKNNERTPYLYFRFNGETSGELFWLYYQIFPLNTDQIGALKVWNIPYAQFIRTDADFRIYFPGEKNVLSVIRAFIGMGYPYKNSMYMPFERTYSISGPSEIRAWPYRSIGPGEYISTNNKDSLIERGSEIAAILNLETRFKVYNFINLALFVDLGNGWSVRNNALYPGGKFEWNKFYKQIYVGTGVGLRLDFNIIAIRFDFGFPVFNPSMPIDNRWYSFKKSMNNMNFNFGIGYPF